MACGMCNGYRRCKAVRLTSFVEEVPASINGEGLEEAKVNLVDALDLVLATQSIS